MKMVGIVSREDKSREGNDITYVPTKLIDIASYFNYTPVIILNNKELLSKCCKVIFPGGDEVTNNDLELIKYCYEQNIPTLGICLGMQEIGCFLGGHLNKINSNINHKQKNNYAHKIKISNNSYLFKILKISETKVNSRHNEQLCIDKNYVSSYSLDGIVESIEIDNKTFFVGVGWHPEDMFSYDIIAYKLFLEFFKV